MECIYIGVDKRQCFLRKRCEGIYQLMSYFKVKNSDANLYSKYVFKRYYYNKLIDKAQDPTKGIIGFTIKNLAKIFKIVSHFFIQDDYGIEAKISAIEKELKTWKNVKEKTNPLIYFEKCGKAYGLILKKAALLSKKNYWTCNHMEILGKNIGMIITMRDSIQDLDRDRITGSFNPFFYWDRNSILEYYNKYSRIIRKKILLSVQRENFEKLNIYNIKNQTNLFKGISIFAAVASNPYGICKHQLNPSVIRYATNNLLNAETYEDIEPQRKSKTRCQLSENCAFDCCASKCENCCECGPKTEDQKACCQACDVSVGCCSSCGECADCV
ncbi:MAG: hypothetical protein FK731_02905 [Asgard group archaeon]|nr:hypothetical protein [Asgard group archaeon]